MILLNRMIEFFELKMVSIKHRCFHSAYFQRLYFTKLTLDNIALAMILGCLPLLVQHTLLVGLFILLLFLLHYF